MKYNKLTILEEYKIKTKSGRSQRRLKCLCDCGKVSNVEKSKVINSITKSCGCVQKNMRENLGKTRMLGYGESAFNQVFYVYKNTAKKRGYEFILTKEQFLKIVTKPCVYCGDNSKNKMQRMDGYGFFVYTGIDRYDNNLGYTLENSVPCCCVCNRIKTNMTAIQMYEHLIKIINNADVWQRTA